MTKAKTPIENRIADALTLSSKWLALANQYKENGKHDKVQNCHRLSQFWLDRFNTLKAQQSKQNAIAIKPLPEHYRHQQGFTYPKGTKALCRGDEVLIIHQDDSVLKRMLKRAQQRRKINNSLESA